MGSDVGLRSISASPDKHLDHKDNTKHIDHIDGVKPLGESQVAKSIIRPTEAATVKKAP